MAIFFQKMWRFKEKVAISPQKVAILDMKNGGDMWRFLIGEVAISTLNFLATLQTSSNRKKLGKKDAHLIIRNSEIKIPLKDFFR